MKKRNFKLFLLFIGSVIILAACNNKGNCIISYGCSTEEAGYENVTTIYDVKEGDCEDIAADYEQIDQCGVSSDWQEN